MLSGYAADSEFNHAALSVFSAKQQAEKVPFVGSATDLLRINVTGMAMAKPFELDGFEKIHRRMLLNQEKLAKRSKKQIAEFMEGLNATGPQIGAEPQTPGIPEAGTSDDQTDVHESSEERE